MSSKCIGWLHRAVVHVTNSRVATLLKSSRSALSTCSVISPVHFPFAHHGHRHALLVKLHPLRTLTTEETRKLTNNLTSSFKSGRRSRGIGCYTHDLKRHWRGNRRSLVDVAAPNTLSVHVVSVSVSQKDHVKCLFVYFFRQNLMKMEIIRLKVNGYSCYFCD